MKLHITNIPIFLAALLSLLLAFPHSGICAADTEDSKNVETPTIPPLSAQSAKEDEKQESAPAGLSSEAVNAYAKGELRKAREIWERLAQDGDAQAMNNLGVLYDQGLGVEPDTGRALHWFAEAANAGNPSGMNNYARMLEQGRGVLANPEEAARWFDKAAREGQPEAQYNLGYLYENGRGVARDNAAAAAWYSRAASLRQKDALARLGHFYRLGEGVEKDEGRAALLLYAAAMEGSQDAIHELEDMAKEHPHKSSATLFGQKLDESDRDQMREALKKSGAVSQREDDAHICDIYNGAPVVPGASEMAICYGRNKKLAFLKIDYAANDRARADAVIKMVENRFGQPTAGEGEDSRLWNLGSVVVATQYAPTHQQISLMYMVPSVYHEAAGK